MASDLPPGLPKQLQRHLETTGAAACPRPQRIDCTGRGSIRQPLLGQRGPSLSLSFGLSLVPASAYVFEAKTSAVGLRRRIREEYGESRGSLTVGRSRSSGPTIDRTLHVDLWGWTLALAPLEAARRTDVWFDTVSETSLRIIFHFGSETWEGTLDFDRESGLLRRFATHRADPRSSSTRRWSLDLHDFERRDHQELPALLVSSWDGRRFTELRIESVELS